jgi:hypothetical protein
MQMALSWYIESEITNSNIQSFDLEASTWDQIFHNETLFGFSNFGDWKLLDIWDLKFGISITRCASKKTNPLWG